MEDRQVQQYYRDFRDYGPRTAFDRWKDQHGAGVAAEVRGRFEAEMGRRSGHGLAESRCEPWYLPPHKVERPRWNHARRVIEADIGDAVGTVDRESDEIVANLCAPWAPEILTRGLVVGHVQSGKTTNFLAVAAKAADAEYQLIIILGGIHNSLRRQTQERAERVLVDAEGRWWTPTSKGDFEEPAASPRQVLNHLDAGAGARGLIVVKKNVHRLQRLANWLQRAPQAEKDSMRVLVIDDEADQAGLDIDGGPDRSGIHAQLMRVLGLGDDPEERSSRVAYVGYTATPFANVLTSQEEKGLYPRDFIYPLEKPEPHMGPPQLFGRRVVGRPIHVVDSPPPPPGDLEEELALALCWFVIATAARSAVEGGPHRFDSTMLIHESHLTDDQAARRTPVHAYLADLRDHCSERLPALAEQYERELERVPASGHGEVAPAWDEVAPHVVTVLDRIVDGQPAAAPFEEDGREVHATSGVIVDNGSTRSTERLTYLDPRRDDYEGVTVVAIGGNTLSRGLTLSGLVCSWFARSSKNYDSLMQMGRWFGYRPGYRHLARLWTSRDLLERFRDLADVEREFREELAWMIENRISPARYGPRIRLLPGMQVTRSSAMKAVRREYSFSDTVVGTIRLPMDECSITRNVDAVQRLVEHIGDNWTDGPGPRVADSVSRESIDRLINEFKFHPDDPRLGNGALERWLATNPDEPALDHWTVAVAARDGGPSHLDLGGRVGQVGTVIRSKQRGSEGYLGVLVDPPHVSIGASGKLAAARYRGQGESPLLLIYPINAESPTDSPDREALDAPADTVGLAIVIPMLPGHEHDKIHAALPGDVAVHPVRPVEESTDE